MTVLCVALATLIRGTVSAFLRLSRRLVIVRKLTDTICLFAFVSAFRHTRWSILSPFPRQAGVAVHLNDDEIRNQITTRGTASRYWSRDYTSRKASKAERANVIQSSGNSAIIWYFPPSNCETMMNRVSVCSPTPS